tara:strand:+ start:542 stop:1204 length:663 start_codon:yes stop_codon:yes gene_type:complete
MIETNQPENKFTPSLIDAGQSKIAKLGFAPFVLDTRTILKGVASGAVRSFIFDPLNDDFDKSDQTSYLGTAVFSNLIFEPDPVLNSTGTFTDIDGIDQTFEGLRIDTVLFQIQRTKNIIKTAIQGKNGTVKEYTSDGDYQISIDGSIVSENPNKYPADDVKKLIKLMSIPESIGVTSEFLSYFGITDVVVESYSIAQNVGFLNVQPFSIKLLSDTPIELL